MVFIPKSMPSLDIIIVNWNAGQQLHDCLASILESQTQRVELKRVVVVDNASSDGSLYGHENIDIPLQIIRNSVNRGFAAACNQGAKGSAADYLLFLNPDTVLFKDSLSRPTEFMSRPENSKVGIVGIQLVDENGKVSRSCTRFPKPSMFFYKIIGFDRLFPFFFPAYFMTEWNHSDNREVDHIVGAFYLIRRTLYESLDGFDERYFVYMEDLDLSLRAHKAGWRSIYLADAHAYHKGGGTSEQVKATRLFYSLRSKIIYCYKHFDRRSATFLMFGMLLLEPFTRLILETTRCSGKNIWATLKGYAMLWHEVPTLLRTVWQTSKT